MLSHRILNEVTGSGIYNGVDPLAPTISRFFVQATIIIGFANFFSLIGRRLNQPKVIFEIIAGIILGPSALSRDQGFRNAVFPEESLGYLSLVANIGLTFYLFIIGIELDTKLLMTHARKTAGIALMGMAVPFAIGIAISKTLIQNLQQDQDTGFTSFFVFIGTAMSITAFPVLARILKEGGLIYTKAGAMTLGAAALNDAIAWCLLALAISIANGGSMDQTGYIFGSIVGIAAFQLYIMKPFLEIFVEMAESKNLLIITEHLFALTICLLFMSAWFTELIGLDSIFGAFLFGLTIPRGSKLYKQCREYIEEFVLTFTLPLYFTLSGLKTDVLSIRTKEEGAMVVLVCFAATIGKFVGAGVSAYLSGMTLTESSAIAVLMNTRGLVELIVLNVGLSSNILNTRTFSVMVIMCLFTTFLTNPLVSLIYPENQRKTMNAEGSNKLYEGGGGEDQMELVARANASRRPTKIDPTTIISHLGLIIESLPTMQPVITLLSYFIPNEYGEELTVTAMHFIEPTKTTRDEFLGLNQEGRLIRVDEETTDFKTAYAIMEDPAAKKPELLPVTGFCKGLQIPVNAFRIEGDPIEYPMELRTIAASNECSLLVVPFRMNSSFAQNFFWVSLHTTPAPICLLFQLTPPRLPGDNEHDGEAPSSMSRSRASSFFEPHSNGSNTNNNNIGNDEMTPNSSSQPPLFTNQAPEVLPIHRRGSITNRFQKLEPLRKEAQQIVVLLTGKHADIIILSLLPRLAESKFNHLTIFLPNDFQQFSKDILNDYTEIKELLNLKKNIKFISMTAVSTDHESIIREILDRNDNFDLLLCAFVEPPSPSDLAMAISQRLAAQRAQQPRISIGRRPGSLFRTHEVDVIEERLQSGMPIHYAYSDLEHPELGMIGSKLQEMMVLHNKTALVLIIHEPLRLIGRHSIVSSSGDQSADNISPALGLSPVKSNRNSRSLAAIAEENESKTAEKGSPVVDGRERMEGAHEGDIEMNVSSAEQSATNGKSYSVTIPRRNNLEP
jgi:Kef-type K+ transport system membrane component KefB